VGLRQRVSQCALVASTAIQGASKQPALSEVWETLLWIDPLQPPPQSELEKFLELLIYRAKQHLYGKALQG
jgi:hypothetical protein